MSLIEGGEAITLPEADISLESVEHDGVKLFVMFEKEGEQKRLYGITFPPSNDSGPPEVYEAAAFDYLHNVIGLSLNLAHTVLLECKEHGARVSKVKVPVVITQPFMPDDEYIAEKERARQAWARRNAAIKKPDTPQSEHINSDGEFQSDKYPWCPPGFVPLKLTDKTAQPFLWRYAIVRGAVDKAFTDDLCACLRTAGYNDVPPSPEPARRKGPPAKQFESDKGFGDMERDEHGARIIYWQQFPSDQVRMVFLDRKGNQVDPDAGDDIWSHCFLSSAPGIFDYAVAYIELFSDKSEAVVRLDYGDPCHSFRLPGGKKIKDFNRIEVGYHNMELRGSPPPWMPGAVT